MYGELIKIINKKYIECISQFQITSDSHGRYKFECVTFSNFQEMMTRAKKFINEISMSMK